VNEIELPTEPSAVVSESGLATGGIGNTLLTGLRLGVAVGVAVAIGTAIVAGGGYAIDGVRGSRLFNRKSAADKKARTSSPKSPDDEDEG